VAVGVDVTETTAAAAAADMVGRQAAAPKAGCIEVVAAANSLGTRRWPAVCSHTALVVAEIGLDSLGAHHCCARRCGARTGADVDGLGTEVVHNQ